MARRPRESLKLEVGCIVYLRSGSQRMVVVELTADKATTVWQDWETKEVRRHEIPCVALDVIQAAPAKEE